MTVAYYERKIPGWLRRLGCFDLERRTARFRWGELSHRWGVGLELINWSEDGDWSIKIMPVFGVGFIKLPFLPRREPSDQMLDGFGFTWNWFDRDGSQLRFNWGAWSKGFDMPWRWKHHSAEILLADGTWRPRKSPSLNENGGYDCTSNPLPDVHVERLPYHYMLDNGEVQHVTATVSVERRTWRRIKWLAWPRKVHRRIDIWFDTEVGERAGSWKGGCLGCGYEMRRDESPRDTLRRMQRERRFR